jgi:hypothetical protein
MLKPDVYLIYQNTKAAALEAAVYARTAAGR